MTKRPLHDEVERYLSERRRLGYTLGTSGVELRLFADYVARIQHDGPVTAKLCVQWATTLKRGTRRYAAHRLQVLRPFIRFLAIEDARHEVPAAGLLGARFGRGYPYIYSPAQTRQLVDGALLLTPRGGLRPDTISTLIGLLASTGVRAGEALRLRREDVELKSALVRVPQTKGHLGRVLPLHPTTRDALAQYSRRRDQFHRGQVFSPSFFVTQRGTPLTYVRVNRDFRAVRATLPWARTARPRLHDLRHSFAVRNLLRWIRRGDDVEAKLHVLSAYMGHVNPTQTYWYLSSTPQLMAITGARFERFARDGAQR